MAPEEKKSAYDDILDDAKRLAADDEIPAEGDFSLEEILAEYGGSRKQRLWEDVDQQSGSGEPEASGKSAGRPPAPVKEPYPEKRPGPAKPEKPETGEPESDDLEDTVDLRKLRVPKKNDEGDLTDGMPVPPKDEPWRIAMRRQQEEIERQRAALPKDPQPVSMETVVGRTVDAVMEEQEELLPERKPRRGLFSRKKLEDTEELYQQPPSEPPPPDPIGPERPLDEMADESRAAAARRAKPLSAAALLTVLLAAVTGVGELGWTIPYWTGETKLQTAAALAVLVIVALLCRDVFRRGFSQLGHRRFTPELLISMSALIALADAATSPFLAGRSAAAPYAVVACAALVFAQWGGSRAGRADYDAYRVAAMPDPPYLVTDTSDGACKQTGDIRGFYTDMKKPDLPARWQGALLPLVLMGTLVFAGLASLGQGRGGDFLLCWSAILAASASFALPLCWGLPWSHLARQLQKCGCAVAGWAGAEAISGKRAMILTDTDIFPPGTIRLNGIKVFGEELPHAVSYAATMIRASGSGLQRLFDDLLRAEGGHYREADDFSFYEEGGCSATIQGESVLLGTASFMRKMEVRLPGNLNLRTGVFLAVDRQLAAVFAVKYSASENVDWALKLLRHNRIAPILAARDPNVTPALLKRKFSRGVRVEYPSLTARLALSEAESDHGLPRALLLREGLMPYAETVVGSRRLCAAARRGTVLGLLGSAAGVLLAYYLAFQGSFSLMTPMTMLIYQLLWALPVLMLSDWTRRF